MPRRMTTSATTAAAAAAVAAATVGYTWGSVRNLFVHIDFDLVIQFVLVVIVSVETIKLKGH